MTQVSTEIGLLYPSGPLLLSTAGTPKTHIKVYDRMPGKMRRVPVSSLDLSAFADGTQTPADPAIPGKPRGLLAALIDLILAIFKRRT